MPKRALAGLWLVFAGDSGVSVRAVLPVDDWLDAQDRATLVHQVAEVADLLGEPGSSASPSPPSCCAGPPRPTPARADRQIFRLLTKAAATRDTVPWSFYVAGPDVALPLLSISSQDQLRKNSLTGSFLILIDYNKLAPGKIDVVTEI